VPINHYSNQKCYSKHIISGVGFGALQKELAYIQEQVNWRVGSCGENRHRFVHGPQAGKEQDEQLH